VERAVRKFVLCADDFALSEPISAGIIDLVDRGRLGAVSCLVTSVHWRDHAAGLRQRTSRVDVGLHLNLLADEMLHSGPDYHSPLGHYPTLSALILRSHLRRLDKRRLVEEIESQLDRFLEGFGAPPDFVDGHRHVHQFPVVRDALLDVYQRRLAGRGCYLRNVRRVIHCRRGRLKARIVAALGATRLEAAMLAKDIPHNRRFGGIYDFSPAADFAGLMRDWLSQVGDSDLIMCHPALTDPSGTDPIGVARHHEYSYFRSDAFPDDCRSASVQPARFRDITEARSGAVERGGRA